MESGRWNREGFRAALRGYLRAIGHTQQELAGEIGLHPHRLSHKLGGTDGATLTLEEVKRIVRALATWEAITIREQAEELLSLRGFRATSFTAEEWAGPPLSGLDGTGIPSVLSSASSPSDRPIVERSRLPSPATRLIGRSLELAVIRDSLGGARLLTLTGPGGVGKTRLAIQAAQDIQARFADGVVFVALAAVDDPALVPTVIAHTMHLQHEAASHVELANHLRERELLLVLDNFEHVLEATSVVGELLVGCPLLRVLVTSRIPLRLYGEHEYRVPPLQVPGFRFQVSRIPDGKREAHARSGDGRREAGASDTDGGFRPDECTDVNEEFHCEAVELFVQRARAVKPDLDLGKGAVTTIGRICVELDGLPLAIELAAARSKLFSPAQLLSRLHDRLGLLTGGPSNLPARQQTLRAALDWSYHLLTAEERQLFRRLAVFNGFDAGAAERVCGLGADALERVAALADHGLLEVVGDDGSEPRFRMLQTVREYALARLAASGEAEALHRHHAQYYIELAEAADPELIGPEQRVWGWRLEREIENVRLALAWLLGAEPAEAMLLATRLGRFWARHGYLAEGRAWLDAALQRCPEPNPQRGRALVWAGRLALHRADLPAAETMLQEASTIFREAGDRAGLATALSAWGEVAFMPRGLDAVRQRREEQLAICHEIGDAWGIADATFGLGAVAFYRLDFDRAVAQAEESAFRYRAIGDRWSEAEALLLLAMALFVRRDPRTREVFKHELSLCRELDNVMLGAASLAYFAAVLGREGDAWRGAQVYGAAEALLQRTGQSVPPMPPSIQAELNAARRGDLDEATLLAATAAGRGLSLDEAVALATGDVDRPSLQAGLSA